MQINKGDHHGTFDDRNHVFQKGGIVMYALLLCSLFVLSIAIERTLYFRRMDSGRAFARDFYLALANSRWQQAEKLAEDARGALADILFAVITRKPEARRNPAAYMEVQSASRSPSCASASTTSASSLRWPRCSACSARSAA